ncbi:MAG: ABZJ_00895 family protein [Maritimibacter sp.]|nr:ABZJ_00895 family protein [Maritimibacter sp.]
MTINFGRYAIVYFLTALGFAVFSALLEAFTGLSGGGGAATVVPAFVAAMSEGQRWVRENGGPMPEKAALWQGAWRCTLAAAAVNAVTFAALRMIPAIREMLQAIPFVFFAVLVVILLGVTLLINRFGLGSGIKAEFKRLEKA